MGGLEIKEVWRPPTSCNLFITSFTFRPCLPLVRGCIWLNTGSTRNHRRKQDNRSHKKTKQSKLVSLPEFAFSFPRGPYTKGVYDSYTHRHGPQQMEATGNRPGLAKRRLSLDRRVGGEHSWLSNWLMHKVSTPCSSECILVTRWHHMEITNQESSPNPPSNPYCGNKDRKAFEALATTHYRFHSCRTIPRIRIWGIRLRHPITSETHSCANRLRRNQAHRRWLLVQSHLYITSTTALCL